MSKLKYGVVPTGQPMRRLADNAGFKASEVLSAKSGRFCVYDISETYWMVCDDNADTIGGYTPSVKSSVGTSGDRFPVFSVAGHWFELPYAASGVAATLTDAVGKALVGKKIDLLVASNIQYADNATSQAILRVVDYDVAENTLTVEVIDSAIGSQA